MTLLIHTTSDEHIAILRTAGCSLVLISGVIKHGDHIGLAFDDLVEHFFDFVHRLFCFRNGRDDSDPLPFRTHFYCVI